MTLRASELPALISLLASHSPRELLPFATVIGFLPPGSIGDKRGWVGGGQRSANRLVTSAESPQGAKESLMHLTLTYESPYL